MARAAGRPLAGTWRRAWLARACFDTPRRAGGGPAFRWRFPRSSCPHWRRLLGDCARRWLCLFLLLALDFGLPDDAGSRERMRACR